MINLDDGRGFKNGQTLGGEWRILVVAARDTTLGENAQQDTAADVSIRKL